MKYQLRTDNIELTDMDRSQIDRKLNTLKKHLLPPYVADMHIERSAHHGKGNVITCTINIQQGKKVFHAERENDTIQTALDEVIKALRQELNKEHDKSKRHGGGVQQ